MKFQGASFVLLIVTRIANLDTVAAVSSEKGLGSFLKKEDLWRCFGTKSSAKEMVQDKEREMRRKNAVSRRGKTFKTLTMSKVP